MPAPAPQRRPSAAPAVRPSATTATTTTATSITTTGDLAPRPTAASVLAARPDEAPLFGEALGEVRRALASLRYGSVTLIVQDGRVVQIESTSKVRLIPNGGSAGGRS